MELEMTIVDGLLTLEATDCPSGVNICTSPLPFRVLQHDNPSARALHGLRNGKAEKIFVIPTSPNTGIPHLPGKTSIKILPGTTVVGTIVADSALIQKWWERTQEFIQTRGKTKKRQDIKPSDTSAKTIVSVESTGTTRAKTRIFLD